MTNSAELLGGAFDLARSNSILGQLPSDAVEALVRRGRAVDLEDGAALVRQGDGSDCAYLVLAGTVEVVVRTSYGEVALATMPAGALIGEIGVFAGLPRNATVRARGAVRALRLEQADLLETGRENPQLLLSVIGRLGSQIARFNNAIGLYTNAVAALESDKFDASILDALKQPGPELIDFAAHFQRMAEQIVQRRAQEAEMASAAGIQRAMLPDTWPERLVESPFDVHAYMLPARQVGGDLYDLAPLDDDHVMITIGDVCGKGVPASLFMAVTQTVMRLTVRSGSELKAEVERGNRLLVAHNKEDMFATWFCAVLDLRSGALSYCNCGHNPPFLLRRGTGAFEFLPNGGPPLGIMDDISYTTRTTQLDPGDLLFLYTDGVTEAENPSAQQFGTERLKEALLAAGAQPARAMVEGVAAAVLAFADGAAQFDDITCVAIRHRGA